jgi:hypothetical protein
LVGPADLPGCNTIITIAAATIVGRANDATRLMTIASGISAIYQTRTTVLVIIKLVVTPAILTTTNIIVVLAILGKVAGVCCPALAT